MSAERLAAAGFALAALVGLVGAFIGLNVSSFWIDEIFTAWVVQPATAAGMFARALSDLHPPVYYSTLYVFAEAAGRSETGLRLFSALCAVGAVLLFVWGSRKALSLPARLFAAAVATASEFWFYQSQNARSYGLVLLLGAALLVVTLRMVRARSIARPSDFALLGVISFVGGFTHWYFALLALAVLGVLVLCLPRRRPHLIVLAVSLLLAVVLYLKLVVASHSVFSTTGSWIGGGLGWYLAEARMAASQSVTVASAAALAICLLAALVTAPATLGKVRTATFDDVAQSPAGVLLFCAVVVAAFLTAALASSLLMSPNFTSRNVLICSPFLWLGVAALYDLGMPHMRVPSRLAADLALVALAIIMSLIVLNRGTPRNDPFRESAQWIAGQPGCWDQKIPVVTDDSTPEERDASLYLAGEIFGYYLEGPDRIFPMFEREALYGPLPAQLQSIVATRAPGPNACPVVAWGVHGFTRDEAQRLARRIEAVSPGRPVQIRQFDTYGYGLFEHTPQPGGFVLYLN